VETQGLCAHPESLANSIYTSFGAKSTCLVIGTNLPLFYGFFAQLLLVARFSSLIAP
jgi:hypothetical protein